MKSSEYDSSVVVCMVGSDGDDNDNKSQVELSLPDASEK